MKIVDALKLSADLRECLRPGEALCDSQGETHRLPRYFYEVPSWEDAKHFKLTADFNLAELILVDCREARLLFRHPPLFVPCAVTILARYLQEIKRADLWIYGAAGDAQSTLWETDLRGGVVLVLGAEGRGLRPLVRRRCDALISIPLAGHVESLNVSVAAAVLLFEARRQRGEV